MDRIAEITRYIEKSMYGIEVGPFFAPITPKKKGYRCLSLDYIDGNALRAQAKVDPNIPAEKVDDIEDVDLIGTSTEIESLIAGRGEFGQFDYVVSSHNFEHLPNPIKFLAGCARVLKPGGYVSMAIPDKRACFDYFRPHTTTTGFLAAHFEDRRQPIPAQVYEQETLRAVYRRGDKVTDGFSVDEDPSNIQGVRDLETCFRRWTGQVANGPGGYIDTHCWALTPSSLRLILEDLRFLGLSSFEVIDVSPINGNEFYVHLRNAAPVSPFSNVSAFYDRRQGLLHDIQNELTGGKAGANGADELTALRATIASMKNSRSWRITAPLRAITRLIKASGR